MRGDHPHSDPGDGRMECTRCGKFVWGFLHSCKGVPVTAAAWNRLLDDKVEKWHTTQYGDASKLHDCLGMTWDEYCAWTKDPTAIPTRWLSPTARGTTQ